MRGTKHERACATLVPGARGVSEKLPRAELCAVCAHSEPYYHWVGFESW